MKLKNYYSLTAVLILCLAMIIVRLSYTNEKEALPVKVTTWDALGYYMYLPAQFIYHDEKDLKWFPAIDSQYCVSGGELYQANKQKNGVYVFKYLEGVSILQLPFFLTAHAIAANCGYPADGFSAPYQYAVAWGCLLYCMLAIFMLRIILLRYFKDHIVAVTLLLLLLASNFMQYAAIESGQSHAYLFLMYTLLLYVTIRWHEDRRLIWTMLIGFLIGLSVICRPTELLMLFIPLFWNVRSSIDLKKKFQFFIRHKKHLFLLFGAGFIGILPQLLYWKRVTGLFVYDVGSKWDFLNPHWRVLFGWEKGWFIYTPVTILFVLGFFFMKGRPFKRSLLTFCLLNIYIIIAWHVWRYGGSYSCRAMVQSYPVFALALACFVENIDQKKIRYLFILTGLYLTGVNLFQLKQYNETIIHYDDMNRLYYQAVYLNTQPDALDMSMLDTDEILRDTAACTSVRLFHSAGPVTLSQNKQLLDSCLTIQSLSPEQEQWLRIKAHIQINQGIWGSYIKAVADHAGRSKQVRIRLFNALSKEGRENDYDFFIRLQQGQTYKLMLSVEGNPSFTGSLNSLEIIRYLKK